MNHIHTPQDEPRDALGGLKSGLMGSIRAGSIRMRPRWHFVLLSALGTVGALLVLLALLYMASLFVFVLRDSGAWFAPSFGGRGWHSFLQAIPWLLLILSIAFVLLLEMAVRRYEFVYRKPMLTSVAVIVCLSAIGGVLIAATPFHHQMRIFAQHNQLPMPFSLAYDASWRPRPPDVYHGAVMAVTPASIIILDHNGAGTTTVRLGKRTRLPNGADFEPGMQVVVIGDMVGSSTVDAFGIEQSDE